MNGSTFTQGLMALSSSELRTLYALLVETTLTDLVATKAKELFTKDVDHFNERLQKDIQKLEHVSDEELRLKLLVHFTKTLQLQGVNYTAANQFAQQGDAILYATHELLLKDKNYEQYVIESTEMPIGQMMVHYQMQQVFTVFDSKYRHINTEETKAFAAKIAAFIITLNPHQQLRLKQQWHVPILDADTIHDMLGQYGVVIVLSNIVEIAGVSAYSALISAIATSSKMFGLTMPIGVYGGAASLLFILANPFFLVALALGGGGLLLYRQNKKLRQALIPIGVLQLLLPTISEPNALTPDLMPLIKEWHKKLTLQEIYVEKLQAARDDLALQKATIAALNTQIDSNNRQIATAKSLLQDIRKQLHSQHTRLRENERSLDFLHVNEQLQKVQDDIEQLQVNIAKNKEKQGLFNSISSFWDNNTIKSKLQQLENRKQALIEERIDTIIETAPAAFHEELTMLKTQIEQIETLVATNTELEKQKTQAKKRKNECKDTVYELDTVLERLQKEYYGIKDQLGSTEALLEETAE